MSNTFSWKSINNEQSNALHLQTNIILFSNVQSRHKSAAISKIKKERSTFEMGVHCLYQGTICSWLFSLRLVCVDNNYSIKIQRTWWWLFSRYQVHWYLSNYIYSETNGYMVCIYSFWLDNFIENSYKWLYIQLIVRPHHLSLNIWTLLL